MRIILIALMFFGSVVSAGAPERDKGLLFYMDKYLEVFCNLTAEEVLTAIDVESSCNPDALRYEAKIECYARGPLQITDRTARWRGYKGSLEALGSWGEGLYWGMEYMSYQKARYSEKLPFWQETVKRKRMFASYNYGSVKFKKKGKWMYRNQGYVNKCERRHKYWKKQLKTGGLKNGKV